MMTKSSGMPIEPVDSPEFAIAMRPPRIVVAEEDSEIKDCLSTWLQDEGYEVIETSDGSELLECLDASARSGDLRDIDLVIADLRMPGISGLDILERIRSRDLKVPFILIAAFSDPSVLGDVARLGSACVLDKPLKLDDLMIRIERIAPPVPLG